MRRQPGFVVRPSGIDSEDLRKQLTRVHHVVILNLIRMYLPLPENLQVSKTPACSKIGQPATLFHHPSLLLDTEGFMKLGFFIAGVMAALTCVAWARELDTAAQVVYVMSSSNQIPASYLNSSEWKRMRLSI